MAKYKHKISAQIENCDPKSAVGKILESSSSWDRVDQPVEVPKQKPDPKPDPKPKTVKKEAAKKE